MKKKLNKKRSKNRTRALALSGATSRRRRRRIVKMLHLTRDQNKKAMDCKYMISSSALLMGLPAYDFLFSKAQPAKLQSGLTVKSVLRVKDLRWVQ